MTAQQVARALADNGRRQVFAAIVLGDADAVAVAGRTGLGAREVATAVRRLVDAGLVVATTGGLKVDADGLRDLARTPASVGERSAELGDRLLRTFVGDGVLRGLPAQRGRRRTVLAHVTMESFEPGVRYPERAVDERLRAWCAQGGSDHVTLRRYLVDEGLLARDQGVYWRTGP